MSELRGVNLRNARLAEQQRVMENILADGVCPFCIESLKKYHKKPIIKTGDHWLLTENQWPYKHTTFHYLAITTDHSRTLADLRPGAFEELGEMAKYVMSLHDTTYGGIAMRFGATPEEAELTGSSVNHLHAHILQATADLPDGEKLRVKFSK